MNKIYFDSNATTPVLPHALEAMLPFFSDRFGNPSSAHVAGLDAREAIETARAQVALLVGCTEDNVVFTSSATEAINTAIYSATDSGRTRGRVVTTSVEHSAVLNYCLSLEKYGFEIVRLGVDENGRLSLNELEAAISAQTLLVSVMWANNETGVIFPIEQISDLCRKKGVLMHVDAVQAAGKIPITCEDLGIDYLSISSHKLFGPKGVGALIVARDAPFRSLHIGGHQESHRRGGTENVAGIVGFGVAADRARSELFERAAATRALRDRLEKTILEEIPGAYVNGGATERIPNTTNVGFAGVDSDTLVAVLDTEGLCASSGSACLSNSIVPSHVVMAMTGSYAKAREATRFSLSHLTTEDEIERAISIIARTVTHVRNVSQKAL